MLICIVVGAYLFLHVAPCRLSNCYRLESGCKRKDRVQLSLTSFFMCCAISCAAKFASVLSKERSCCKANCPGHVWANLFNVELRDCFLRYIPSCVSLGLLIRLLSEEIGTSTGNGFPEELTNFDRVLLHLLSLDEAVMSAVVLLSLIFRDYPALHMRVFEVEGGLGC